MLKQKVNWTSVLSGFCGAALALVLLGGVPSVWAAVMNATVSTANTTTAANAIVATCNTTGTPAAGYGCGSLWRGQDGSKTAGGDDIAGIYPVFSVVTSGAEIGRIDFKVRGIGSAGSAVTTGFQMLGSATVPTFQVTDGTRKMGINVTTTVGQVGTQFAGAMDFVINAVQQWQLTTGGVLTAKIGTGYLDMGAITAGGPVFKIVHTSDSPSTTYTAHVPSVDPSAYLEVLDGATPLYIPLYP